ncbi:SWIM zinc finger family protein [Haladaptatus sp. CMSO5]|uniref:SWIM zinc finger family protein n=1 Tax=Haladaptatus sp. CMSO5 TaxID=3120514 RepID=UPI002FCE56A4
MTPLQATPASPARKIALAPDTSRMDRRSARAWTERMAVRQLPDGRYAVDSESGATYVVDLAHHECSCPDYELRHAKCKHLRRVALEITLGRVPPPGKFTTKCAVCGDRVVARRGEPRPYLCSDHKLEAGDRVTDRETGDRLIVYRVTTDRADEVEIPSANTTVAGYPGNHRYDAADLVVEVVYPSDTLRRTRLRRYSFPYSRLARPAEVDASSESAPDVAQAA